MSDSIVYTLAEIKRFLIDKSYGPEAKDEDYEMLVRRYAPNNQGRGGYVLLNKKEK